ncbi:MAG TPA: multiheme c-type cytochrome [Steroidobacteraceae bacterium]|nr:multiheme c-type cytochrome [Steroidobacteraceae bacterium]
MSPLRWSSPLILVAALAPAGAVTAQTPSAAYKHLGVASCASSVCHGKTAPQPPGHVPLNEYRTWFNEDRHAQAYHALESAQSRQIAAKLGLPNAQQDICLNCHADNVPKTLQGPKFQVRDGVTCEVCHGGSEKWIEAHAQKGATHAGNVALGLYPSEQPLKRAQLCLSCHLGTRDKFATHMIMGAGHPRLYFELGTFTVDQPAHFKVTDYYVSRKGKIDVMNLWVTGQLESAERYLTLLQTPLFVTPGAIVPELSFYDCNACHHPKEKMRWSQAHAGAGVKPGTLRLQRQSLLMLQALLEALGTPDALSQLAGGTDALVRAGGTDAPGTRAAAQKLLDQLHGLESWTKRSYSSADIIKVRKTMLRYGGDDRACDYGTAEQVVLGVQTLSYALGDYERRKDAFKSLFDALGTGSDFNAPQFAEVVKRTQAQF